MTEFDQRLNPDFVSVISKMYLWQYVHRKIKKIIHGTHVLSIVNILFEEMIRDLRSGKEIKIARFGTLEIKQMLPRKYHNVRLRRIIESPGYRTMRFFLFPRIQKKLTSSLDLDSLKKGV